MKRIFYLLILLTVAINTYAYDFQSGDFYYNITSSSAPYTAEVTYQRYQSPSNYSGLTIATIPETVTCNGTTYSVTSIGDRTFYYCRSLTSVTIPESVKSIGDRAFYYCRSLTSVTIPNSVTSIGNSAFSGCSSLTSITISNSVTSIGDEAFYYCRSLTSVTIPESVKSIGNYAFYRCMFTIDNFVNHSSLDANANNYWGARVGNVEIDGLLIRNDTVIGCRPYVTTAVIPNSVTSIGDEAFSGCSSLTSVTIPNSVTSIGNYAFCDCSSLTSITIPNSVTSIGSWAFTYCSSLTSITIPNSVTSIGDEAFRGCSLTSITIPNSVTSIGNYTFYGCSSLTSPVYNAHCFAYLPTSFEGTYIVPDGIKQIAGGAFRDCRSLTSITIPNSVTSIGSWAFTYCSSLTSVTIPESVTSIGDEVFAYCSSLTSMSVEDGNTTYDSRDNCNAIIETATNTLIAGCQNTIIPNSVTSIGYAAFSYCSSLTSITIPNSVTSIGNSAFANCSSLTSITIPNSVTSIGSWAFYDCSSLDTLTCLAMTPPALLGEDVFDGCNNPTLFVPCEALSDYQLHEQWGQFTTIECISSEEAETEEVVIESGTTTVIITWPTEEGADTYTIVIKKDGEVVCTLTFNSEGQLINIAFAPGRNGNHPAQYAEAVANGGFRFTVTGLEASTDYNYTITSTDTKGNILASYSGEFTTQSTTAVDNITTTTANIQKIMRNGQLIILRDGVEYNAMGQKL